MSVGNAPKLHRQRLASKERRCLDGAFRGKKPLALVHVGNTLQKLLIEHLEQLRLARPIVQLSQRHRRVPRNVAHGIGQGDL